MCLAKTRFLRRILRLRAEVEVWMLAGRCVVGLPTRTDSRFPFDFAQGRLSTPLRCGRNDELVQSLETGF